MMIREWFLYLLVTVLAGMMMVVAIVTGYERDSDVDLLLRSADVVQRRMVEAKSANGKSEASLKQSPLVREAEMYAKLVKPVVKPQTARTFQMPSRRTSQELNPPRPRPTSPSAVFTLLATSCYPSRPYMMRALISEPGKGTRWVRCGQRLGYLLIEEIHNGYLVYGDGMKQHTLYVRPEYKQSDTAITMVRGDH